jgi:hypothetical protein
MTEQQATVTVQAPVHQVYSLFTHFGDFPKFMHFVREITTIDAQRTHWVVHVLYDYQWTALHEDWIPDQQIGWRSVSGLQNTGRVKFRPLGPQRTMVSVYISYAPPTGPLGALVDHFSASAYFAEVLHQDLENFVHMVEQTPPGVLDPMASHYLFHSTSAFAQGHLTERQKAAMANDPRMTAEALAKRQTHMQHEETVRQQALQAREAELRQRRELELKTRAEQQVMLAREQVLRLQEEQARADAQARAAALVRSPDHILDTIGGRNASIERTAAGDRDGRNRFLDYERDPMTARYPIKPPNTTVPLSEELKLESPWWRSIRGTPTEFNEPPAPPPS